MLKKTYLVYSAEGTKLPMYAGNIEEVSRFLGRTPSNVKCAISRHSKDNKLNCYVINPNIRYKDRDENDK